MKSEYKSTATNSALMRQRNRKTILSIINREPISRVDIAKITGLTKAAVSIIVDELKSSGIVAEEKGEGTGVGRTPFLLSLCSDSVYVIGINIRRVGIYVGIADICGRVICEKKLESILPERAFLEIGRAIEELCREYSVDKSKIYKASVVTPGPVDIAEGRVLNPPNFRQWHGVEIVKGMSEVLECEVIFANVSSAAAVAESYFGAAKGSDNFLALLIDEGIGSGIISKGQLFDGYCELGHVSIKHDGDRCECGNYGCLEGYASIPNALKGTPYKTWQECMRDGRQDIALREAEYLGCAIATANNLFDIDSAVLCGEIARGDGGFFDIVRDKVLSRILTKKNFNVLGGTVTSHSLIAASMAVHDFFSL